jgi:hypothetical protein
VDKAMMGMKKLYEEIEAKLASILNPDGTPAFKHLHTWNQQVRDLTGEKNNDISIPLPAVFVEIIVGEITKQGEGLNHFVADLHLHICHQLMNAENGEFEQNWEVFDLMDLVHKNLQGTKFSNTHTLVFKGFQQDFDHGNVYHLIMTFNFTYEYIYSMEPVNGQYASRDKQFVIKINT